MYSKDVTMINNYFDENWGASSYGLLLKEISDSYIATNYFKNNTSGIYMEGTNRIKIEKNVRVQYSNPFEEECEYISVCTPAFSMDLVNRED